MNAIANVATNVERASLKRANNFTSLITSRTSRTPTLKINRQTIYAVRKVLVTRHNFTHPDAHYVIFA